VSSEEEKRGGFWLCRKSVCGFTYGAFGSCIVSPWIERIVCGGGK
jgi:hypothetical protein